MAKRILPYRDYSEHDVVNLFSLDTSALTLADCTEAGSGEHDSGVVVQVKAGVLPGDMHDTDSGLSTSGKLRDYLGASFSSAHIGYNAYPFNGMTVEAADDSSKAIGITLRETLAYDENGEKMLYYKQKLDEAQGVLPGQTVPVLTRGLVLLTVGTSDAAIIDAAAETNVVEGAKLAVGTGGTLVVDANGTVGTILAVGKNSDVDGRSKALCRISF